MFSSAWEGEGVISGLSLKMKKAGMQKTIFKINSDSQERNKEEEIGYLSDYENDACCTGGKEEEGEGEGCESEFCDSGGEIDKGKSGYALYWGGWK